LSAVRCDSREAGAHLDVRLRTMPLSDAEAKQRLRSWPTQTRRLWSKTPSIRWLRAQPIDGPGPAPRLALPGAGEFRAQPDGLWVTLGIRYDDTTSKATFADCIAVESCGTGQNYNDKRSRYAARTTSLMIEFSSSWLDHEIPVQAGARRTRRELLRGALPPDDRVTLPVRHLRVLYALEDDGADSLYARVCRSGVLEAHEFVCRQQVLGQYNAQDFQRFLKGMAPDRSLFP
jgi:hypothetical protein